MDKAIVIERLDEIIEELHKLRDKINKDESPRLDRPYWFDMPIAELQLKQLSYPNVVYNACRKHNIKTIGQLASLGYAAVSKWQGIGPKATHTILYELKDRFDYKW